MKSIVDLRKPIEGCDMNKPPPPAMARLARIAGWAGQADQPQPVWGIAYRIGLIYFLRLSMDSNGVQGISMDSLSISMDLVRFSFETLWISMEFLIISMRPLRFQRIYSLKSL